MRSSRPTLAALCLALAVTGCITVPKHRYSTPLTGAEGRLLAPALVSTAEGMGLEAAAIMNGAQVTLEDGTKLMWWDQGGQFVLWVDLAQEREDLDVQLRETKVRADQIWELAVQARQANNVGAVVLEPGATPAAVGAQPGRPGGSAAPSDAHECSFDRDCPGGKCRFGKCSGGAVGAQCTFNSDCPSGRCSFGQCK